MLVRPFYSTPVYLHWIPLGMCEEECLCLCHCISQACSDHYGPILWETFNVEAEGIAGCPRRAVLIPVMFGLDIPASFYCFLILPIFTNPSCNCYFSHIFVALLKCNILDIFFYIFNFFIHRWQRGYSVRESAPAQFPDWRSRAFRKHHLQICL